MPLAIQKRYSHMIGLALALSVVTGCNSGSEAPAQPINNTVETKAHTQPTGAPSTQQNPPRPAMWKLSDDDTHIFLFGGVHMLPKGIDWQTGWVDTVVDNADMLILELSPEEQALAPEILADLSSDNADMIPLEDRIPPQLINELDILASRTRVSRRQLDGMESWAAALLLSNAASRNASLSIANGTEAILTKRFMAQGKPISGLETAAFQLSMFDRLTQRTQDALLTQTVQNAPTAVQKTDQLIKAWASGDTDKIALYADSELRSIEGLSLPLLTRRNAQWANWINDRMEQPGTILIAVGAGHLVGDDSVQNMLEKKGLKVVRVQ